MSSRSLLVVGAAIFASVGVLRNSSAQDETPSYILIKNVNIFDGIHERLTPGKVLVENNLIKEVGAIASFPQGATVIDGGGRTLMPGLIDTHVHMQLVFPAPEMEFHSAQEVSVRMVPIAEDMLFRGFTLVRDAGGNSHGLRRAINDGSISGPRIVSAGAVISARSGHGDFSTRTSKKNKSHLEATLAFTRTADGPEEVREAIREEMRAGSSFIKLMIGGGLASAYDPLDITSYSLDEIKAAVDETERWGTYCTAHLYTDESIEIGVLAGMKTFEHTHLASEETYALFANRDIPICAQVAIVGQLKGNPAFVTPVQQKKAAFMAENGSKTFDYAKKYGVSLGFGVDSYGTLDAFRFNSQAISERKKYFTDWEIIQQIYANNMRLINMCGERLPYQDGSLGVVQSGAYADVILVDGDPLKDVAILSDWKNKIDFVMKDGAVFRDELE